MATALTPLNDVTWLYLIKFETSDSFVNHFDGHFAYLKTLDFNWFDV